MCAGVYKTRWVEWTTAVCAGVYKTRWVEWTTAVCAGVYKTRWVEWTTAVCAGVYKTRWVEWTTAVCAGVYKTRWVEWTTAVCAGVYKTRWVEWTTAVCADSYTLITKSHVCHMTHTSSQILLVGRWGPTRSPSVQMGGPLYPVHIYGNSLQIIINIIKETHFCFPTEQMDGIRGVPVAVGKGAHSSG